jgi:hypothetical protein
VLLKPAAAISDVSQIEKAWLPDRERWRSPIVTATLRHSTLGVAESCGIKTYCESVGTLRGAHASTQYNPMNCETHLFAHAAISDRNVRSRPEADVNARR